MDENKGPNGEPSEEELFNRLTTKGQHLYAAARLAAVKLSYANDTVADDGDFSTALAALRAGKFPFKPGQNAN